MSCMLWFHSAISSGYSSKQSTTLGIQLFLLSWSTQVLTTYELEENAAADPMVAMRVATESFMFECLTWDCENWSKKSFRRKSCTFKLTFIIENTYVLHTTGKIFYVRSRLYVAIHPVYMGYYCVFIFNVSTVWGSPFKEYSMSESNL